MSDGTTYVGLDAHKKEHQAAMYLPGSDKPIEWRFRNEEREIARTVRRVLRRAPGPVRFCYEAGVCGFHLQRAIERAGATCSVIAPSLVPVKPGDRIKTDPRDARDLGKMFRAGLLTEVHPPDPQQEALRDLCRAREAAHRDVVRIRQQLSKFLLRRGVVYHQGRHWTQRHRGWLRGLRFSDPLDQQVYGDYLVELDRREERLASLESTMRAASLKDPWRQPVGWLRCFRGIDTVTALSLVGELYGIERFGSARQLMSYLGLTPSEHSSGEHAGRGGLTKTGNKRVRRLLIEASWHQTKSPRVSKALRQRRRGQPAGVIALADRAQRRLYRRYWHLVHNGKVGSKAVAAVARELAGFIWAVLRAGPVAWGEGDSDRAGPRESHRTPAAKPPPLCASASPPPA